MSDPHGPWQDYGQHSDGGEGGPHHLPAPPGLVRPYVYGVGHDADDGGWDADDPEARDDSDPAGGEPGPGTDAGDDAGPNDDARDDWDAGAWDEDDDPGHSSTGADDDPTPGDDRDDWDAGAWDEDDDAGHGGPDHHRRWSLRAAVGGMVWRYRSAPVWARFVTGVVGASAVLALILGLSLAARDASSPQQAAPKRLSTSSSTPSVTVATTTATTQPTTATSGATTTTSTTVARSTTTTARPAVPAPTVPPPPPTEPTTTTTRPLRYRNCAEASAAGALPLYQGEPGYGPHLDRDSDGEACEADDRSPP